MHCSETILASMLHCPFDPQSENHMPKNSGSIDVKDLRLMRFGNIILYKITVNFNFDPFT